VSLHASEFFNADKRKQEASNERARNREHQSLIRRTLLQNIGQMQGGIEFFSWIFEITGIHNEVFAGNSGDAHRAGKREIGKIIETELKLADWETYTACELRRLEHERREQERTND
jgi:hypothetical protein